MQQGWHLFLKWILMTFISIFSMQAFAFENAFYILHTRNKNHLSSPGIMKILKMNVRKIDILISQAYSMDKAGKLAGFVDKNVYDFANEKHIKLMAMITNAGFDKNKIHQFLTNQKAQGDVLQTVLAICKRSHFYGVQFDFENIPMADKDLLTKFYLQAADLLHKNGYRVSFAIITPTGNDANDSAFLRRKFQRWQGGYDLKALGNAADFITLMTYDQHTDGTTPGPTASIRWVNASIEYALQYIPADKISLGIPTYSGYWRTIGYKSGIIASNLQNISYQEVLNLQKKYHFPIHWDNDNKINVSYFENHWLYEYIFTEDAKSFKARLDLAKYYRLRGISVFVISYEDPAIWSLLSN